MQKVLGYFQEWLAYSEEPMENITSKKMKDLMVPIKHTKTCDNCRGNGYLNVVDSQNLTQVKQCWVCESEGEIKNYDQVEVDNFIYGFYHRKRLH